MKTLPIVLCLSILARIGLAAEPTPLLLESQHFRYTISPEGRNVAFVDSATGTDYLRASNPSPCAMVRVRGQERAATAATLADGRITLQFGTPDLRAVLKAEVRSACIVLSVESLSGEGIETLTFLNAPLTLKGTPDEPFGACAHALNLVTRVDALPALQSSLRASCEKKFGLAGARVAIVAAPMKRMLPALQATLADASELPVCRTAGPWAREVPFNHGSYLFNFGSLTETNVADWIGMAQSLGFTQIDNHGGGAGFFRFGSMELNRAKWPDGWDTWQRIVARLHQAGIGSIFHTYAFFIDKQSRYVTPVPDRRLDAFRAFTLAEPLSASTTEIAVNEPTAGLTTVTGFFEHNSVVLHIGDELVTFGGVSRQAPWRFTGVKRGALGTKAAAHEAGAKARHLKECFGLFVPDPESSLFTEIAANHADVVNRCGFDGVYLDAIDGSSILRGPDECWYWADKFVVEIQKRLKQPIGMEMSAMWHQFWQYRTRWQAWDYPQRGHVRFVDLHAAGINGGLLLPLHLGWWGFQSFNPPQIEPTYPDVIENLGARLVGWDAGVSLTAGIDRETLRNTPLFRRAVDILRTCENLRHENALDESVRASLREPGSRFTLVTNAAGQPQFRRVAPQEHVVCPAEPWTLAWQVTNAFQRQPLKFRLEALISAAPITDANAVLFADLAMADAESWKATSANGVTFALNPGTNRNDPWRTLIATNTGKVARNAAWVRFEKRFSPVLNLKDRQGLAVEVEGDGSGALVAIRLESPRAIAFGAIADRYLKLDFTGRRTFTLVETESARWSDYVWNDGKHAYNVYRETIDFGAIESASIWLQNLPPGRKTQCRLGPVRDVALQAGRVKNPRISVGGHSVEFPIELASGSWIECNGPDDCATYAARGEPLGKVIPRGDWPTLPAGVAGVKFSCVAVEAPAPRARVTVSVTERE
ncbi:MAG TPA: hypothetical protein P5205_17450 [Candidatus Paceibacterota bacterium]|nr:hypothetical protein [Candidatus Paceibacterota bacterium]